MFADEAAIHIVNGCVNWHNCWLWG
jgi:hypothetical protein